MADDVEKNEEIEGHCTNTAKFLVTMAKCRVLFDSAVLIVLPLVA